MILRVGLTGGIGAGKSTAAQMFAQLGSRVIDADRIVSRLYEKGAAGYDTILENYGPSVLGESGEIDRKRLSDAALGSAEGASRLNALIHPLVLAEQKRLLDLIEAEGRDQIVIVEATLLLESGGRNRFDRIIVVDVPTEIQIERAVSRGMDRAEVERRMSRQMPREERLNLSDYVISNMRTQADLRREVEATYRKLEADLSAGVDSRAPE